MARNTCGLGTHALICHDKRGTLAHKHGRLMGQCTTPSIACAQTPFIVTNTPRLRGHRTHCEVPQCRTIGAASRRTHRRTIDSSCRTTPQETTPLTPHVRVHASSKPALRSAACGWCLLTQTTHCRPQPRTQRAQTTSLRRGVRPGALVGRTVDEAARGDAADGGRCEVVPCTGAHGAVSRATNIPPHRAQARAHPASAIHGCRHQRSSVS